MALWATWSLNTTGFLELQWEASETELATLRTIATEHSFAPQETILTQGDTSEEMYLILEGRVRIVRALANQPLLDLARLGPLSSFGEMAFSTGCPRTASVIAETTVRVLSLTRSQAKRLWTEDPQLALNFYHMLARALIHSLAQAGRVFSQLPQTRRRSES
jgi:CRP-like cAMP-binding protein